MKDAILEISNLIKNYTFGLMTTEECWQKIVDVINSTVIEKDDNHE